MWFCVELRGGWTACYLLRGRDGRPVVVELRVLPSPVNTAPDGSPVGHHEAPGDGLTAATLKDRVVMGRHVYELLPAAMQQSRGGVGATPVRDAEGRQLTLFDAFFGALGFNPSAKPRRGRRGPKPFPDRHYAALAADYVDACSSGSRSPVKDVATARGMTPAALRTALHRARNRGLLTRQTAGRAGGQLTRRAKRLHRGKEKTR